MTALLISHEGAIRLAVFIAAFALIAGAEIVLPRRRLTVPKPTRWVNNLALTVINALAVRALFPSAAVGMAMIAEARGFGLLQLYAPSTVPAVIVSLLVLDLAIYLQHVLFHAVPALWRLHRVHHADLDFDVTTGVRFHPVEIVLSMLIKFAVIVALGAPALAVFIFELALSTASLFNHGNLRLPPGLDRALRFFLVTPDMHRVHHSILPNETNSNFGFNLPWWDHLFGTYRAQPSAGHEAVTIGIEEFRNVRDLRLDQMLLQPLRKETDRYSIRRRTAPAR